MKANDRSAAAAAELPGMAQPINSGRPRKSTAKTNAERQRDLCRKHKALAVGEKIAATITRFAAEFELTEDQITRELLRFALCKRDWMRPGFSAKAEK